MLVLLIQLDLISKELKIQSLLKIVYNPEIKAQLSMKVLTKAIMKTKEGAKLCDGFEAQEDSFYKPSLSFWEENPIS